MTQMKCQSGSVAALRVKKIRHAIVAFNFHLTVERQTEHSKF